MKNGIARDLSASVVVFLVALPLCLGIAVASGAPPISGLIAGIVGGIVVGTMSGSRIGVSGPAAGLTAIVLSALDELGSFEIFLGAVIVGGVLQIIMGAIKAGAISQYFPNAVIKGMLSAIGIILILKQIPHAIGYDADPEGEMSFVEPTGETTFSPFTHLWELITPGAVIITAVSLLLLLGWDRFTKKFVPALTVIPGALMAVAGGIGVNQLIISIDPSMGMFGEHLVGVPNLTSGEATLMTPDFAAFANPEVYLIGLTIAIIASLETLLCVEATDKIDPEKSKTPKNRELYAQGAGNIVAGFLGGLPVTQVIVRSSANVHANAATKKSAIIHGLLLVTCILAIPNVLNMIPLASLAAILLVVGYKLASIAIIKEQYSKGWSQFIPYAVTIIAILMTDLLIGIGIGLGVAVIFLLFKHFQHSHEVGHQHGETEGNEELAHIVLAQEMTFIKKASVKKFLENAPEGSTIRIDARANHYMDQDIVEMFEEFESHAKEKNIRIEWENKDQIIVRGREHGEDHQPEQGSDESYDLKGSTTSN